MSFKQIFKRVLIPCAAAGVTVEKNKHDQNCVKNSDETRPSKLPIYSNDCNACESKKKEEPPSQMEEAVCNMRKELWVWQDNIKGYRQKLVDVYRDSFREVDCPHDVPDKCADRNHIRNSMDDSCYPLPPCPDVKPPKTKQVEDFKCYKPPVTFKNKEKKVCIERCKRVEEEQQKRSCSCCQQVIPECGRRK